MVNTQIKKLAGFGVLFALLVVSVGAYTRLADAGLGCPDWPGCYGFLTVPDRVEEIELAETRYPGAPVEFVKAWWEMGHRYIAGALLVLVFSMLVMAYRGREREDTPLALASVLMVIILCQAAFGGIKHVCTMLGIPPPDQDTPVNEIIHQVEGVLEALTEERDKNQRALDCTRTVLHKTESEKQEQIHLVKKHIETECKLNQQAQLLLEVSDEASKDLKRVHDKVERQR